MAKKNLKVVKTTKEKAAPTLNISKVVTVDEEIRVRRVVNIDDIPDFEYDDDQPEELWGLIS